MHTRLLIPQINAMFWTRKVRKLPPFVYIVTNLVFQARRPIIAIYGALDRPGQQVQDEMEIILYYHQISSRSNPTLFMSLNILSKVLCIIFISI